ncbi:acyl-CoA synthetase [Rhodobium gokarnense]|uniref:Acyl-CoA synthetase (AMP-forming)/AMP-acid ligase II n=1 Tax=Rhodobium gokarnense TaxID=364296 RepID=A0ABT3HF62_9HYPH|nr:acyl-CoA synthetase [Rhodobium gokarnense]MCW2309027.1 acyl-CoA synthetase (AMP-forming)/AMP-acid ligase II [Rhodobium gokarnense]
MKAGPDSNRPPSTKVSNLAHFLTRNAARLGARPAIVWGDTVLTWADLDARVSALAAAMREDYGIGFGDRVLLHSPNNTEITETMLACWRLGAVWVPANFRQSADEVAFLAEKADVSLMVCEAGFPDHAAACLKGRPQLQNVLRIGPGDFGDDYGDAVARHLGTDVANAEVDRDDPCWLFFTSGSTGRPKAVVLTHGQLTFTALNHLADLMPGTAPETDASLVVAPLSHGAGMHQLTQIVAGVTSILTPKGKFDPAKAWELIERYRITNLFTVPTIVKMLTESPAVDAFDHSSLRYVIYAGAPMYREDQKYALKKLGKVLVQYFGLGEVTGAITVLPPGEHFEEDVPEARIGTCGIERTGIEVSIQDDFGKPLGPNETGEICVTGPAVCAGYFRDDHANAAAFRNGWFRTGDLGHLDAERFLYITGRASDMYISGGSNVYPREIEEILLSHPALNEVAVLGVPDPQWGECGLAVCVPASGAAPSAEELAEFLSARLARYKLPARYVFLDEMPKTGYGKITKKLVREHLAAEGLLETAPS